ncbi:MAG: hypothetical protein HY611_07825 [Elusimicrobia bacterium]|nr:hypothetical protein [Elusimicrobiota bacterium]
MGWTLSKRGPGDHFALRKPGYNRPVIIPDYAEVPKTIIKANLNTAKISLEEYFREIENL